MITKTFSPLENLAVKYSWEHVACIHHYLACGMLRAEFIQDLKQIKGRAVFIDQHSKVFHIISLVLLVLKTSLCPW